MNEIQTKIFLGNSFTDVNEPQAVALGVKTVFLRLVNLRENDLGEVCISPTHRFGCLLLL